MVLILLSQAQGEPVSLRDDYPKCKNCGHDRIDHNHDDACWHEVRLDGGGGLCKCPGYEPVTQTIAETEGNIGVGSQWTRPRIFESSIRTDSKNRSTNRLLQDGRSKRLRAPQKERGRIPMSVRPKTYPRKNSSAAKDQRQRA